MESEALDKRMAREATIGLVVLVALVGLLFLTIWLKARAAWSVDDERLLASRVNVFEVDRGNVLTPLKTPPPVPLPDIESNHIVDLGEMRPISSERMAAMMGSGSENLRVAVIDPDTTLPGFPDGVPSPSLPSPLLPSPQLPNRELPTPDPLRTDLPSPDLPQTDLPRIEPSRTDLPPAPSLLPQLGSLPAPGLGPEALLPTMSPEASVPTGLPPVPGEQEKIPNREPPAPESTATDPDQSPETNGATFLADTISAPIRNALHRAAAEAQSSVTTTEADDSPTNTTHATYTTHSPYSTQELKAAMRRLSLPSGVSMSELSQRLYGDTRYALALQQLNHRRADDRGRFLPGTQIVYLPAPMLSFVYPDLVTPASPLDKAGTIETVQYQQPLPLEVNSTTPVSQPESDVSTESPHPASPTEAASDSNQPSEGVPAAEMPASTVSPEWITTEGGESLFQLAVDHFDQASYYLQLYEWNRVAMEGRYRPTDPLPKGMRIRLAPPTP